MSTPYTSSMIESRTLPYGQPELPVFNFQSADVLARLAAYGGCMIVAPPNTGKSLLLEEVADKAFETLDAPVLLIDADKLGETTEETIAIINRTTGDIRKFSEVAGPSGVLLIDNVGSYSFTNTNKKLNAAKRRVVVQLFGYCGLLCTTVRGTRPAVGIDSDPLAEVADYEDNTPSREPYYFKGIITEPIARRLLEERYNRLETGRHISSFTEGEFTYSAIKRLLELPREKADPRTANPVNQADIKDCSIGVAQTRRQLEQLNARK